MALTNNHYDKYLQTPSYCSPVIKHQAVSHVSSKTLLSRELRDTFSALNGQKVFRRHCVDVDYYTF